MLKQKNSNLLIVMKVIFMLFIPLIVSGTQTTPPQPININLKQVKSGNFPLDGNP